MANMNYPYAMANGIFKSLSIFPIALAVARLALQYDTSTSRIQYVVVTFLLVVEIAVAIAMASISSYRFILLDHLDRRQTREAAVATQSKACPNWHASPDHQGTDDSHLYLGDSSSGPPTVEPSPTKQMNATCH
jgi:hypothetical protein